MHHVFHILNHLITLKVYFHGLIDNLTIYPYYFQLLLSVFLFHLFVLSLIILIIFLFQSHAVFRKMYILVLKSLNSHLTFLGYCLFHHPAYLIFFSFHFLFRLFSVLSIVLVFFISFNIFFEPLSSSLNSSIIIYFFEGAKELIVRFDLVPKSLYLFVSDSAELYSIST